LPICLHASYDFICLGVFKGPARFDLPSIFSVVFHAPAWLVGEPGKAGLGALPFFLLLLGMVWRWLYRPAMLAEKEKKASDPSRTNGVV
jgi:hypothetical protein